MDKCIGYLRLEGVDGECTEPRFLGCIVVAGIQMVQNNAVLGSGNGPAAGLFQRLVCSGPHTDCEPRLLQFCSNHQRIKSATLTWMRGSATLSRITLKDVFVDTFATAAEEGTAMTFALTFGKIEGIQLTPKAANNHLRWLVHQVRNA